MQNMLSPISKSDVMALTIGICGLSHRSPSGRRLAYREAPLKTKAAPAEKSQATSHEPMTAALGARLSSERRDI
ncbi:hypothetical protein B0G74_2205 [Paraburkholderia sp. BL9I2N2]|jgi:hypothetical protein|nr:hypothetical protein B0G74_2205 [Paraburkholderia sp. BL9I2N2]